MKFLNDIQIFFFSKKRYSNILKGPLTLMFQHSWDSGRMPQAWKVGLIKLVPKVASPESFHQWRPISLMGSCIRYLQRFWQIDYKSICQS